MSPHDITLSRVLRLRRAISQAAASKYAAVLASEENGRIQDTLIFRGASRTGRWSGRRLQLQNMRRPPKGVDQDAVAQSIVNGTFSDQFGGDGALDTLGGCVRAVIRAEAGKTFVVSDLASIESRVLGWLANDLKIQQIFRDGKDMYKVFAAVWFGVPYDGVTSEQRNLSKPVVLGAGFGLGAYGLVKYADSMGIEMDEETARTAVTAFRKTYHRIPAFWRWVEEGFRLAMGGVGTKGIVSFHRSGDMVIIRLPSGRGLYYQHCSLDDCDEITYMGMNQYTRKWERIRTYGARIVENIVQAVAADILAAGIQGAERYGLNPVSHVHDEVICEMPEDRAEEGLEWLNRALTTVPPWGRGLILGSEGYINRRYRKG